MRKISTIFKRILMPVLVLCLAFGLFAPLTEVVRAEEQSSVVLALEQELKSFIEYNEDENLKQRLQRVAGSEAEYNSFVYIKSVLDGLVSFVPVTNGSTEQGVSTFNFTSLETGDLKTSRNLVYIKEAQEKTDKKVVLACHYDSAQVYEIKQKEDGTTEKLSVVTDGVSDNAGAVATLISLAKALDQLSFVFNVEVVFFGAGAENHAGAEFYLRGLTDAECKNILLMVNLDKIGVGAYNYYYVNEYKTPQDGLYNKVLAENLAIKKLEAQNVVNIKKESINGLDYSHVGLESEHACFMERNINVLNFFSGDYQNFLTYGLNEYNGIENITYTKNDNYDYVINNCANYYANLESVYNGVLSVLSESNFIKVMELDNGAAAFYGIWGREKIAVFITAVLLFVFIFAFYMIYYNLNKKSKEYAKQANIDGIVFKIASNIGKEDEKLNDALDSKIKDDLDKKQDEE